MKKNIAKTAILKNIFWLLATVIFYATYELADTFLAVRLGEVFDIVTTPNISRQEALLSEYTVGFVIILSAVIMLYLLTAHFQACYIQRICTYTREKFFNKTLEKSIACFDANDKAYYQSILINDMKQLESNYYLPILTMIKKTMSVIIALAFLAHYSILILFFVLIASFLPIILPKLFEKKLEIKMEKYEKAMKNYTLMSNEILAGYEVFRNYNAESRVLAMHSKMNESYAKINLRAISFMDYMQNSAIFSGNFVMLGVLILGMILSAYGHLSVGNIFAIYFISGGVTSPFNELIQNFPKLTAGKVFVREYEYHDINEKEKAPISLSYEISIKNFSINFKNQDVPTIKNISLSFQLGKKYLLVGPSGGGKSTIIKSILGFYDDYVGEVTYDNIPLSEMIKSDIFDKIAYLPQQPNFFQGSIRENLSVFDELVTDKNIEEALKAVELYEKIVELGGGIFKSGLNATISEKADNFSGGEKQCLALARVLIKNVNFLVLDEVTSAIDIKTSVNIEKKLLTNPKHTVIFAAHRLHKEVLCLYDEIIVVDSGKIVEKGNFDTLIAIKGNFYNLYNTKGFD